MLLGGVLVGMGLPFSSSIKDNNNFIQCNMFLVRFWLFASDEVMVFCLAFVLTSKGNPHLCVYMNIYGTFPTLQPNKVFIHMFLLGGIHFQTGVCLR